MADSVSTHTATGHTLRVRIAVVGPFSGPRAAWGELLTTSATAHRHAMVDWEFHDDRGDAAVAVEIASAIVDDDRTTAVIGHFNSLGARDALPIYQQAGLPLLLPLATRPGLLDDSGAGALRWCPDDLGQFAALREEAYALGLRELFVTDDRSEYGRGLAEHIRLLPPGPVTVSRLDGVCLSSASAVVVCGTHFGAAETAHRLRADGFEGRLLFTDDCAVEEFVELLGDAAFDSRAQTVQLSGGALSRVDAAFAALVGAVTTDPAASGPELLAAVRARTDRSFTADGDLAGASTGSGWEVVPVAAAHYDVVVIGAGVVGAASAAALSEAGVRVAVAAPGPEAHSATRYSGGLVRAYEPDPGTRKLAVRSYQLLWGQAIRTDFCFHRTGSLVLLGPEDIAAAERGVTELTSAGIKAEILAPEDVHAHWPDLTVEDLAGAVWEPDGGYAHPPLTTETYLKRARAAGATELPHGLIHRLTAHPRGVRLEGDVGPVTATAAVVAAGSGTPELLGERLPGTARTKRIRYAFFQRDGRELPAVSDLVIGLWGRPQLEGEAAGGFLVGRPVEEWNVPATGGESLSDGEIFHIREGVSHRFPWIAGSEYLSGRFGTDLYGPDGPLLGPLPGELPVVLASCWSGAGFKTAPAVAEATTAAALSLLGQRADRLAKRCE